jgi:hypothetical protein
MNVRAEKNYAYHARNFSSQTSPDHAIVELAFSNSRRALPMGTVRVYIRDTDGTPKFAGEQRIYDTPANSDLVVKMGEAFDVTVQSTLVSSEALSRTRTSYGMRYEIRNAMSEPVRLLFRQDAWGRDSQINEESLPGRRINATTYGWTITVPANGQTDLTFNATIGY